MMGGVSKTHITLIPPAVGRIIAIAMSMRLLVDLGELPSIIMISCYKQ